MYGNLKLVLAEWAKSTLQKCFHLIKHTTFMRFFVFHQYYYFLVDVNQTHLSFSVSYCIFKLTVNKVFNSTPVLPSYRNQSIDLHNFIDLTGFYMRATLTLNGLKQLIFLRELIFASLILLNLILQILPKCAKVNPAKCCYLW